MKKYAVITGASSGIGKEFAKILANKNYNLILVARREKQLIDLKKTFHTDCEIIICDLSNEYECYSLCQKLKNKKIDIFINNAGFGDCGHFINTQLNKDINMINVNIKALHILTKFMIQHMQKENHGYLLNVASVAGLLPAGPYMATYYATKSYVTSLTCAIAKELKDNKSDVYIGCLCPGPVQTEFNAKANVYFPLKGITASYCAQYALKKMFQRKIIIIPTLKMKLITTFGHLIPTHLCVFLTSYQQKRKLK